MMKITCPYCGETTSTQAPSISQAKALKTVCAHCHKPIAVYSQQAAMQMHHDRSIRAVLMESSDLDNQGVYLEVVESDLADSQILPVPLGESVLGRYNKNSRAELQVLTDDVDFGRNQARLWLTKKGNMTISDNDSIVGTYVNGTLLASGDRVTLHDGDVLTMGATVLIVHLDTTN